MSLTPYQRIREKRQLAALPDRELVDVVRGLVDVDRAVKNYRKSVPPTPPAGGRAAL